MTEAPRLVVEVPLAARAAFLARAYADVTADPAALAARIDSLRALQPAEVIARWQGLAAAGAHEALAAELMALHYDPRYAKSRERRAGAVLDRIAPALDEAGLDAAGAWLAARLAGPPGPAVR
jgi:tRNA 2-selenouridine synthase